MTTQVLGPFGKSHGCLVTRFYELSLLSCMSQFRTGFGVLESFSRSEGLEKEAFEKSVLGPTHSGKTVRATLKISLFIDISEPFESTDNGLCFDITYWISLEVHIGSIR